MLNRYRAVARRAAVLGLFLAMILIMGIVERTIPFDFIVPGVKLGLANAVVLTAIYLLKFHEVFLLVLMKCVLLFLLFGNAVAFVLSLSGSVFSFLVMWIVVAVFKRSRVVSPVGVSVLGAVAHNFGQIAAASFVVGTVRIAVVLPVLILSGVVTGVIVGLTVKSVLEKTQAVLG